MSCWRIKCATVRPTGQSENSRQEKKGKSVISQYVFSGLLGGHQPFYIKGLAHTATVMIIYHTLHKMDSEVINVRWWIRTEVVLQEIANEDPIGLERQTPFQQNRVFLGVVGSQDGHLCWNCKKLQSQL